MKKNSLFNILAGGIVSAMMITSSVGAAEDGHDHDHDHDHDHAHEGIIAGPNGGRVFTSVEPHLEFLITADRKVQFTALNDDLKPVAMEGQIIRVVGGNRSNPVRMSFTKSGDTLVSDKAFPAGNDFPVVIQIKPAADAKSVIEKFNLNLSDCPSCDNLEYACTCDHGDHSDHEGHDHDDHEGHDHDKKK